MKILSNITPENVRKIQELIRKKTFKNIDEFVKIAVENQLSLELSEKSFSSENFINDNKNIETVIKDLKIEDGKSIIVEMEEPQFKDIKPALVAEEEDMWIWGQINKILPVKFSIRYLFNLLKDGKEGIELEEFYQKASELGRELGVLLLGFDEKSDRRRDERLSTGFPIGEEKSKSFSRFCSQFVGFRRLDGILSGALFVLKFANLKGNDRKMKIGITKSGAQFAKIKNPIFDDNSTDKSFSDEEINFYLNHIIQKAPGEAKTFYSILDFISQGTRGRDDLNSQIREIVPKSWNIDFINTQRAGAVSRLYELGLIIKSKEGKFVDYEISEKGRDYLKIIKQEKAKDVVNS